MGSRFDASDRRNDDMVAAIHGAAASLTRTMAKGFELVVHQIAAARIPADNTADIEASVQKIRDLTDQLQQSLHSIPTTAKRT
jgi:hypothetical protein